MKNPTKLVLALAAAMPSSVVFACASCGCTLNSDWGSQGLASEPGWSVDVRYDALNQNQLRAGTGTISPQVASQTQLPNGGGPAEVEQYTNNHYLTTTLDYNHGDSWGVSIAIPYIDRAHSTLGNGGDGSSPASTNPNNYTSDGTGIGDVRIIARYYGFPDHKNFGIQFGLKLPTGNNSQTSSGGTVQPVDPGLQLGTGTTDVIVGAYYFDNLSQDWSYFVQTQFQSALTEAAYFDNASYRPGDSVNVTAGIGYHGFESFTPTLQINARDVQTDSGTAADTFSTGGTLVYVTPGVVIPVTPQFAIHSDVQVPVYQNLNGIQLAPTYIFSIGARYSF